MLQFHECDVPIGTFINMDGQTPEQLVRMIVNGLYGIGFVTYSMNVLERLEDDDNDMDLILEILDRFPISCYLNAETQIQLCGNSHIPAWNGNKAHDSKMQKVLISIERSLSIMSRCNGGVIVSAGSTHSKSQGIQSAVGTLNRVVFQHHSKLYIQTDCKRTNTVCTSFQDVHKILFTCDVSIRPYLSICINVLNLYINGKYNFSNVDEVDRMFKTYDTFFSGFVPIIVLEDSGYEFASHKHASVGLGEGCIWGESDESLEYLLLECVRRSIDVLTHSKRCTEIARCIVENKN